ncbi:hypothetical protein ACVWYN_003484 [Pedobacter sp. UYP24]
MTIKFLGATTIRITVLCVVISCNCAFGQMSDFNRNLKIFNVEFKMPTGFVTIDSSVQIVDGISGHVTAVSRILLKSLDGHMAVAICFNGPIDTVKKLSIVKSDGELYDPNKNYIPFNQKFVLFDKAFSRKTYNADVAGTWNLVPFRQIPVLSPDENCRVIFLHKENKVDIEIYHYYSGISQQELANRLKRLEKMLKFKKEPKREVKER